MKYYYQEEEKIRTWPLQKSTWAEHYIIDDNENQRIKRYIWDAWSKKFICRGWKKYSHFKNETNRNKVNGYIPLTAKEITGKQFKQDMFLKML